MLVEIDSLRVTRAKAPILRGVNISLERGTIYGLLGPNGAGKTTSISVAMGLIPRDAGTVMVLGKDPRIDSSYVHARVGVLPERSGFYDWMTAQDYLQFFARLYGRTFSMGEIARRLDRVGLAPRPGQAIATFSRGMRQRLGLARALIPEPELLVLDEPTIGLDPGGRKDIHDILRELTVQGVGILLCTHLLDDVDKLCSHIGVLLHGRTVAQGELTGLLREHAATPRRHIRLSGNAPDHGRTPPGAAITGRDGNWLTVDIAPGVKPDGVWREFFALGWNILEIREEAGGLESLYLSLTEGGQP